MSRLVLVLSIQISSHEFSLVVDTHHTSIEKEKYRNRYKLEQFSLITSSRMFPATFSRINTNIIITFEPYFHQDFQDNQNLWELSKFSKVSNFELCLNWFEFFPVHKFKAIKCSRFYHYLHHYYKISSHLPRKILYKILYA